MGQTSWGKEDILKGPQDLSLNDVGVEQALKAGIIIKDLSKKFSKEAVIITSNLKRAFETAQRINKYYHYRPKKRSKRTLLWRL